jgi:Uri superfamily endonuclease
MENPRMSNRGSYALVLRLQRTLNLEIGRLGHHRFLPGFYIYLGSALGPGGIKARIQRHLQYTPTKSPHWHVDRLLGVSTIDEVWWKNEQESSECLWAARLATIGKLQIAGFGASDCRCAGHLVHFKDQHEVSKGFHLLAAELFRQVIEISTSQ